LVILHVVRIAVFDGWVSLDAVLAAQVLVHGAVHIGNESSLRVLEFIHELVPSRLHGFAVSSPRGEELDEHGFTAGKFIKVIGGELDGAGNSDAREKEGGTQKKTIQGHQPQFPH
jgi:hypothetical protein